MRTVAAYDIAISVEHRGMTLEQATREVLHEKIAKLGGDGGIIAIDASGRIVMDFNSQGMFRGARDSTGARKVGIGP
jgi:beta-aspartyl-peptidase (threonine type)